MASIIEDAVSKNNDVWAKSFEIDVHGGVRSSNPMNSTKLTGINRWLTYCGLGWRDPAGVFQPNPYFRVKRSLTKIFGNEKSVTGELFMEKLAGFCPELDGGGIYNQTNPDDQESSEECTLGLGSALVDLHKDEVIRLLCPRDARGWSIARAKPSYDQHIKGNFLNSVKFLKKLELDSLIEN